MYMYTGATEYPKRQIDSPLKVHFVFYYSAI